jgi:hypothetical protein
MITRRILLATIVVLVSSMAHAQSVKLTATQITELLTGNTAIGKWEGQRYRQFFNEDGQTIFAQEGARSSVGKWRIDAEIDEYQSVWPAEESWKGWYVMEFSGRYYWVSKSTPPTPFKVEIGQQLIWPDE